MVDGPELVEDEDEGDLDPVAGEPGFDSLDAAFGAWSTTKANEDFLRRVLAGIDVQAYFLRSGYLKVTRASGEPSLQVHLGYTNGFRSKDEVVAGVRPWASARRRDTWGVTHPDHGPIRGAGERKPAERDGGRCSTCGDVLPMSGLCNFCA